MPYHIVQAPDVLAIPEEQFGVAQTIQFTKFTSCIGVLAKVKGANQVIGIHLVMVGLDGSFNDGGVNAVMAVLNANNYDPTTAIILGQIAYWQTPSNGVSASYQQLVNQLRPVQTYQLADGYYGATVDANGDIELTYQ